MAEPPRVQVVHLGAFCDAGQGSTRDAHSHRNERYVDSIGQQVPSTTIAFLRMRHPGDSSTAVLDTGIQQNPHDLEKSRFGTKFLRRKPYVTGRDL
jgi:hypothetical protein